MSKDYGAACGFAPHGFQSALGIRDVILRYSEGSSIEREGPYVLG